jgi:hypothetical protein
VLGGSGSYTATLRGTGFAQVVYVLELLAIIPALSPLVRPITTVLVFVATWIASVEAHDLRGWRGALLPLVYSLVLTISLIVAAYLAAGTGFTIESFLQDLGFMAPSQ